MDGGDAITSAAEGAVAVADSEALVENDVLQEQTAAAVAVAAPSKLFPNQMGNTGFRRTESTHSSLFVSDQQVVLAWPHHQPWAPNLCCIEIQVRVIRHFLSLYLGRVLYK